MTSRRDFVKGAGLLTLGLIVDPFIPFRRNYPQESPLEQKIIINIPSYELSLLESADGAIKRKHLFPVGVGKGRYWRNPTPIGTGQVIDKRPWIHFFFEHDKPERGAMKGDVIYETWTFDEKGNPMKFNMPYDRCRGLGLLMNMPSGYAYFDFVIHSTSDEFTIGTPCSNGCIRVGMDDMLKLYSLVAPNARKGGPKERIMLGQPIPVETRYDLVELKDDRMLLHANIYNKKIDYLEEFKKQMFKTDPWKALLYYQPLVKTIDSEKLKKDFADAEVQFKEAHNEILLTLLKDYPKNYLVPEMKTKLHRTLELKDYV